MPRGDGTGPMGLGPRTGRGLGFCGWGVGPGCGYWSGWGYGRGLRKFASPKNELVALDSMEKVLEEELAAIREEKLALKDQQK